MKEKMTNEHDRFQPFLVFSSPWEQVAVFFSFFFPPPPPLVLSRPVFEVSLSLLYTMVLTLFGGMYLEQNTVGKESLPLSVPNSFLSLPVSRKT